MSTHSCETWDISKIFSVCESSVFFLEGKLFEKKRRRKFQRFKVLFHASVPDLSL